MVTGFMGYPPEVRETVGRPSQILQAGTPASQRSSFPAISCPLISGLVFCLWNHEPPTHHLVRHNLGEGGSFSAKGLPSVPRWLAVP